MEDRRNGGSSTEQERLFKGEVSSLYVMNDLFRG
jgi:hypothetical protein